MRISSSSPKLFLDMNHCGIGGGGSKLLPVVIFTFYIVFIFLYFQFLLYLPVIPLCGGAFEFFLSFFFFFPFSLSHIEQCPLSLYKLRFFPFSQLISLGYAYSGYAYSVK